MERLPDRTLSGLERQGGQRRVRKAFADFNRKPGINPDSEFGDQTLLQIKTASCSAADARGQTRIFVFPRASAAKSLPMF